MSTPGQQGKSGGEDRRFVIAGCARNSQNGRRTTLIARKLAATTSLFVGDWKLGQILLTPGVLGLVAMSDSRSTFPESEHPRPRAALGFCDPRMIVRALLLSCP